MLVKILPNKVHTAIFNHTIRVAAAIIMLTAGGLNVAANDLSFKTLSVRNGLPQMSVLDVLNDSRGYVWFATRDGLARYNGYDFTIYKYSPSNNSSLSNNYVTALAEDQQGRLWVGTMWGLNLFDPATEQFQRFFSDNNGHGLPSNKIRDIVVAKDKVWVCTSNGICLWSTLDNNFTFISLGDTDTHINTVLPYTDQSLIVATDTELLLYNLADNSKVGLLSEIRNGVRTLYHSKQGVIYVGTNDAGLYVLDRSLNTTAHFTHDENSAKSISHNSVRCMAEDSLGNIMIGTFNGFNIFDPTTDSFVSYHQKTDDDNGGLSFFSSHSVCCDSHDTVWLGTWAGGVNYTNLSYRNFLTFNKPLAGGQSMIGIVGQMLGDKNCIWIAMEGSGLVCYDRRNESYTRYLPKVAAESDFRSNLITSLCKSGDTLWVGTNNGWLFKFDTRRRQFVDSQRINGLSSILTIFADSHGTVYLGLMRRDGLAAVGKDGKIQYEFHDCNGNTLHFNNICSILEQDDGTLLLGSNLSGIYTYNPQKRTSTFSPLEQADSHKAPTSINQLYRDSQGILWAATIQDGLLQLDQNMNIVSTSSTVNGLPSNSVCSVTDDSAGNIWVSTLSSVSRIGKTGEPVKTYICSDVNEFSLRSYLLMDGIIYFGADKGFVSFDPNSDNRVEISPSSIVFEKMVSGGKNLMPKLWQSTQQKKIRFKYNSSNISFGWCAINYINPHETTYAYRLDDFDKEWVECGTKRNADYTNLPTGDYVFRIMATNDNLNWVESSEQIRFTILPPPWKSWWAYLLYVLAVVAIVWIVMRIMYMRVKWRNDFKLSQIEKANADKMHAERINLFTNFSHELRTPLTLIIAPLEELLRRTDLTDKDSKTLTLMNNNAKRLLFLVNQLLDFRKKESGRMEVRAAKGDFATFVKEIVIAFNELARTRNITLGFQTTKPEIFLWYDRQLMEKVLFNLLSNAFKNTPDGGQINVAVECNQAEVSVSVSDTGCGIASNDLDRIFDPFYQSGGNEDSSSGTGIGLCLTKGIVELHHGTITVHSIVGQGSNFIVTLPTGNSHFKREEIIEDYRSSEDITRYMSLPVKPYEETKHSSKHNLRTILIADDNRDVRSYMKDNLLDLYNIIEATNGNDTILLAVANKPDLILSDIMMPGKDGIQVCRTLKNDDRTKHIPIILLTARSTVVQIEEGLQIGADDYITKPFNMSFLRTKIANILLQRERLKTIYAKQFNTIDDTVVGDRIASADERFLQNLYSVTEKNISNPKLGINMLCQEIGISKTNLYYKIKALTGFAPTEFIRETRLQFAAQLLTRRNVLVSEVATMAGFNNHSYFSNCFREKFNCSPSEYASRNKQ